jgi:hypothetical protein
MLYYDTCQISELIDVLTTVVIKPIASLIAAYSFENLHQRFGMRLSGEKYLSYDVRIVLHEYSGLSWVAESIIGRKRQEETAIGANFQDTSLSGLRGFCACGRYYTL